MRLGWPYHERMEFLSSAEPHTHKTKKINFQNQLIWVPYLRVSIDLPLYRLNNGRTLASQHEYIQKNGKAETYFTDDPEIYDVQQSQHEILSEMTKAAGLEDLFSDPSTHQTDPLILTEEGFVANGNRRLCVMRKLFHQDPATYQHFSHIDVVVLPIGDETDIVRLEADIQLEADVTQDYSWLTIAVLARNAVEKLGMTYADAGKTYRIGTGNETRKLVNQLEIGELYLETRNKNKQYSLIEHHEFAFQRMAMLQKKMNTWPIKKRIRLEQLAFCLIDKPEGGRLYQEIQDLYNGFDDVVEEVEEDHAETLAIPDDDSDNQDQSSSITALLGGAEVDATDNWLEITPDEIGDEAAEEIRTTARNAIQSAKARSKADKTDKFVFNKLRDAHKSIQQAVTGKKSTMMREGVAERIVSIETALEEIRMWVEDGTN